MTDVPKYSLPCVVYPGGNTPPVFQGLPTTQKVSFPILTSHFLWFLNQLPTQTQGPCQKHVLELEFMVESPPVKVFKKQVDVAFQDMV